MLKNLLTGKLSLPMTFWGWGFCGGIILGIIKIAGIHWGFPFLVPISHMLQSMLFSMVIFGLVFILKEKITFLGLLAFFVTLFYLIMNLYMFIGLRFLFLK